MGRITRIFSKLFPRGHLTNSNSGKTFDEMYNDLGAFEFDESGSSISIYLPDSLVGKMVDIHVDNEYIFSSQVGKKARIKIDKGTDNGKRLMGAFREAQEIKIFYSR